MGLKDFVDTSRDWVQAEGAQGLKYSLNQLYMGLLRRTTPFFPPGTNVYDKEWDLLLLIDGCRVDAIEEVADEYSFLDNPGTNRSTASTSWEWMKTTFTSEHADDISKSIYVTANQHSEKVSEEPFIAFEDVYNYGWDNGVRTIPAETVTDTAIRLGREFRDEHERMIVHYMQPHFPSVPKPIGHGDKFDNVWKSLMIGTRDVDQVWDSYIENLRYVLDSIEVLLENIDAETVAISADHGNAKGEWWVYGHPHGMPLDCLREVPWYTTTATDRGKRIPEEIQTEEKPDQSEINERLKALGYRA
ncbi:hypothetical protein ACH9L7_04980 [Haloferax sp. S1W]|uniref:hypothetical protein n=1 Tax=Haloferax sp. S1W TaxID=3377110 RepID=UPI0037CC6CDB